MIKNINIQNYPRVNINFSPKIPPLKKVIDKTKIDIRYCLISPFAFAHIYWDPKIYELVYKIEEPILDEKEEEHRKEIVSAMRNMINFDSVVERDMDALMEYIDQRFKIITIELGINLSYESYKKIYYYLCRDFIGFNETEPLLRDYFVEDIECNGAKSPVYIVHRIYRNIKTNLIFNDMDVLESFVEKLSQRCGKYISYAQPILDGSLPDGSRVNATYTKDITSKGPTFCFADGYLQLGNGEVIRIDKFFQQSKKDFGYKIENGNEVVELNNLTCCGVNEKNLNQVDSKLKTVIKLPPPKELVRVKFSDGSDITTTTNHLFHIADSKLKLIESKDLKKGMFAPMPSKVNARGCLQTINAYNLIKEFSYSHKICILSNTEIKSKVSNLISNCKTQFNNHRQQLAQEYEVHQSYFYEIVHRGCSISFEILEQISNINEIDDLNLVVYGGGTKGKSKAIKIPREVDKDLAYLAGAIISDGHLGRASVDIACYENGFAKSVISKLIKKFGKADAYYNGNRIYLCNLFAPYFFNKVFQIPYQKKHDIVKVPQVIFKSDNDVIASFIRGLFDGDGTCKSGLSYKTNSKQLAEELTYLLSRLGIYSKLLRENKNYRVLIPSIYEKIYSEKIGFDNFFKKFCLNKLLEKKNNDAKSYINSGRVPAKPIFEILSEMGISKKEAVKFCNVCSNRLIYYDSLSKPFVKQIMSLIELKIKEKNLKNINLDYLKWLVNCNQEFIKIDSVEIFENKEQIPVYDIELEPCKFFIAGNKPMNVFDTIRKFTKTPWTPTQLLAFNTLSPEMLAYLWLLVQHKMNILIAGGTASGKTTLLNAIAFFIPQEARVVSIEDTRELNLPRENWLPSVVRASTGIEKVGEIDLFTLLRSSFRQNPDYVIVGEVRGKEAYVLFQGMASGHSSISTIHADSVDTVIKRLKTPPIELSPTLLNVLDCVCIMTHAVVNKQETRKLKEIVEIINVTPDGVALTNTPFVWNPSDDQFYFKRDSKIFQKISKRTGLKIEEIDLEFRRRVHLIYKLHQKKIFDFNKVQEIINEYIKKPEQVLREFGIE